MKKVSICLCAYNGEKYIKEQLDSILNQTYDIDEVVIIDDCSNDSTVEIIENFISANNLSNWKLHINNKNVGWKKNFINSFNFSSSDIIFCCDQDDIWFNNKIEAMVNVIEQNTNIDVLACNLLPLYENGSKKIANFYIKKYKKDILERVKFKNFEIIRPGCTMCFKRELLPLINKLWYDNLAHDSLIYFLATLNNSMYILNKTLMKFRRHVSNNSPENTKSHLKRAKNIKYEIDLCELFLKNSDCIDIKYSKKIKKIHSSLVKRYNYLINKSSLKILLSFHLYVNFGIKKWLSDLYSSFRK